MKTGIIGCGQISEIYAENCGKFRGLELVACADLDLARAQARAAEAGIPKAVDVAGLLADPEVEIVVNLTIPAAHAEIGLAALRAGKSVYLEKPLALRRSEARAMIRAARESNLRVGCAPDTFLGAGLQTCRKLIDEGAIGEPIGGIGAMLSPGVESWHANPVFFYQKGAGPLFDMGPYYLTALTTLFGPVARVTACARASFPTRTVTSQPLAGTVIKVEVPTHVASVLEFESGPIFSLNVSFDVLAHHQQNLEIFGSEGTLRVPDPNTFGGPVLLRRKEDSQWREIPLQFSHAGNCRGIGLADMAAAIRSGREHRANEKVAYHVLDLMHCIYDASDRGRHVRPKSSMTRPAPLPASLPEWSVPD